MKHIKHVLALLLALALLLSCACAEDLTSGAKGEAVERLQKRLYYLGFLSIQPDGDYGPKTVEAVTDFQTFFRARGYNLRGDGVTEAATQELPDGSTAEVYLMVPQDAAALNDYIDMHERTSRQPTPLGETGVVLTEKLAELLDVKAGDTVTLVNGDGVEGSFTVSGVCENYVSNYVYMSAATYADAFGQEPEWNNILSRLSDDSQQARDAISTELLAMDEVASLTFTEDMMTQVLNMLNSINAVVVMIVVCAAVLALVVLYNLTNINVAERVKEIATIKVLGFYDREVSAYVMRETVALTIIGALFGLAGGIALHRFVIYTVEVDAVMFGRTIDPSSFVYSLALTMLFSLIVNLLMGRKLKHISMVESMKAPE